MGLFRGKKKRGLFLTCRKRKRSHITSTPTKQSTRVLTNELDTLSPIKKRQKLCTTFQRKIIPTPSECTISARKPTLIRRTLQYSGSKSDISEWETDGDEEFSSSADLGLFSQDDLCNKLQDSLHIDPICEVSGLENTNDTILYSDDSLSNTLPTDIDLDSEYMKETNDPDNIIKVVNDALKVLKENEAESELLLFLKLVADRQFPLDNAAFRLFLDVVRWFGCDDTRSMRYNDTSLRFFWLGKHLFGGKFLRFLSGPKNESDLVLGKTALKSSESKVNFACPHENVLRNFNPLGFDVSSVAEPGIIHNMIGKLSEKTDNGVSFILMFDGKKVKRGSDVNLLGFESDPATEKKRAFDEATGAIYKSQQLLQEMNKKMEMGIAINESEEALLKGNLHKCFCIISRYLMELRKLRVSKQLALKHYKERIAKDPSMIKTLQYAMDSCRTATYLIDNSISDLIDTQWHVCRTVTYLNGALQLFAKSKCVSLGFQENVKMLKSVAEMKQLMNSEHIPTQFVKQRSPEWFEARQKVKVTGSTIYGAVGADGLKRQKEHYDSVICHMNEKNESEKSRLAMQHGTDCEIHELATLASVVMPFLCPDLVYWEEGFYKKDNVVVSPDGSLRKRDNSANVQYAFEGKAPVGNEFDTKQHYKVPVRYITQTVFEQEVLNAKEGCLYLCWTPESTTVFNVPKSEEIYSHCLNIIDTVFNNETRRRPTRLSTESKDLKEELKEHVSNCTFIGEFPSVWGTEETQANISNTDQQFSYSEVTRAMIKTKSALKKAYNLKRTYASQVLVYLLSDLDRYWKPEIPHAVPVMYCYRGYSLSMEIARNLLHTCRNACLDKGLDVIATSSDGEFNQLMCKDRNGDPLTEYQLSKVIWSDVCKMRKNELLNAFSKVNKGYSAVRDDTGKLDVVCVDGGSKIRTPKWVFQTKAATTNFKNDAAMHNKIQDMDGTNLPTVGELSDEIVYWASVEMDETMEYNCEEMIISNTDNEIGHNDLCKVGPLTHDEVAEILNILLAIRPNKWKNKSVEGFTIILKTTLNKLTKDELQKVALYLNQKFNDGDKIKTSTKKGALVIEIAKHFGGVYSDPVSRKRRRKQPKSLQKLALEVLNRTSYPKKVLNIAYATHIWPHKLKTWRKHGHVAEKVVIKGTSSEMSFQPYYLPEFDRDRQDFNVFVYDKTHLGTNLRKCVCLNKVRGVSILAWKEISKCKPDVVHPSLIEVSEEGKIMDQMKEQLARTLVSEEVEKEMIANGFQREADFCRVIREGLFVADDVPGISAWERCNKRLDLIEWLKADVDFGRFPPYGGTIKGMSSVLYEGLRSSQEAKLYLYALTKTGTYCVRAANTLCSESFFGSMQEMDPWGQGILSTDGVNKHISDFTVITSMRMETNRNIYIQTKKKTVYPRPESPMNVNIDVQDSSSTVCHCRKNKFIQCVNPRDHFFDTPERARLYKGEKTYKLNSGAGQLRGELPIRAQYGYKINEARILPSKRLAIDLEDAS